MTKETSTAQHHPVNRRFIPKGKLLAIGGKESKDEKGQPEEKPRTSTLSVSRS